MVWLVVAGVVTALLLYPAWVVVHEGAHALAVLAVGGKVQAFRPWPQKRNGEWVFGWIGFKLNGGELVVYTAPYIVDTVAFVGLFVAAVVLGGPVSVGGVVASVAMLAPVVNTCVGVLGRYRGVSSMADLERVDWQAATAFLVQSWVYAAMVGGVVGAVVVRWLP